MTQWMIINQLEGTAVWFNLTDCPCFLRSTCLFFSSTLSVEMRAPSMAMSTLVESLFSPRASYGNRSVILSLEQLWNNQGREDPTLDWKQKNTSQQNKHNTTPNTQRQGRCLLRPASMDEASSRVRGRSYAATCATNGCTGATWGQADPLTGWKIDFDFDF